MLLLFLFFRRGYSAAILRRVYDSSTASSENVRCKGSVCVRKDDLIGDHVSRLDVPYFRVGVFLHRGSDVGGRKRIASDLVLKVELQYVRTSNVVYSFTDRSTVLPDELHRKNETCLIVRVPECSVPTPRLSRYQVASHSVSVFAQ